MESTFIDVFTYLLHFSIISTDILNVIFSFLYHRDILIILFYFSIFIYLSDLFMLNLLYQTVPQSDVCGMAQAKQTLCL